MCMLFLANNLLIFVFRSKVIKYYAEEECTHM
jgi:hypothetical protein